MISTLTLWAASDHSAAWDRRSGSFMKWDKGVPANWTIQLPRFNVGLLSSFQILRQATRKPSIRPVDWAGVGIPDEILPQHQATYFLRPTASAWCWRWTRNRRHAASPDWPSTIPSKAPSPGATRSISQVLGRRPSLSLARKPPTFNQHYPRLQMRADFWSSRTHSSAP